MGRLRSATSALLVALSLAAAARADLQGSVPVPRAKFVSSCVGSNCSPGSQAAVLNDGADVIKADVGGPGAGTFAAGFAACVYYRPTSNMDECSFYPIFALHDGASERVVIGAGNGDCGVSWPTQNSLLTEPGFSDIVNPYTASTTNPWAACLYAPDGTGETAGGRFWLFERSLGVWTERIDTGSSGTQPVAAATTDAIVHLLTYPSVNASAPFRVYYAWIRNEWNGVSFSDAAAQTNITDLLGCSVNPSDSDFRNIWPFTQTSTSSETDLRSNTNLAFTSITRATGDALWTGHGSGASAECDP